MPSTLKRVAMGRAGVVCSALLWLLLSGCEQGVSPAPATKGSDATLGAAGANSPDDHAGGIDQEASIRSLVASEELILQLTSRLALLKRSVSNLSVPDFKTRPLFSDRIRVVDLSSDVDGGSTATDLPLGMQAKHWPVDRRERTETNDELQLWSPLLDRVDYFEDATFYLIDGNFAGDDLLTFDSHVGFSGLARLRSGRFVSLQADLAVQWKREAKGKREAKDRAEGTKSDSTHQWLIVRWDLKQLRSVASHDLLFHESLVDAIPDVSLRGRLTESKHYQIAQRHYYPQLRAKLPDNVADDRFFPISTANHPGLSVVDIDQDGDDDLYVTVRWGKNLLLNNQGDGTFEDVASSIGLDIDGRSNASIFCDFDNDGDKDLMLARSLERSAYLVNEQGRFVDRTKEVVDGLLPFEATSISAADYNGDGLLDVYFSTYHQDDVSRQADADLSNPQHRVHNYLSQAQSAELKRRFRQEHQPFLNQVGPPNVLLVNRGDKFEIAPESDQLAVWRNSFQATWCDFDRDGDPDLYVANDFAADRLFRNDGSAGFRDVTEEAGIGKIGFAMGVSWGDYDNNGTDDLYVSNMYSKAGRRITRQVAGLDDRISHLATGNYLYRNEDNRFSLVSDLEPTAFPVANAGWAWGGQFTDLDNDGFLDLYVPSGYYTAPDDFKTEVDL